jgi:hypothetical protein
MRIFVWRISKYIEGSGVYGTPSRWAQVAFWGITSILLAVLPERK